MGIDKSSSSFFIQVFLNKNQLFRLNMILQIRAIEIGWFYKEKGIKTKIKSSNKFH